MDSRRTIAEPEFSTSIFLPTLWLYAKAPDMFSF